MSPNRSPARSSDDERHDSVLVDEVLAHLQPRDDGTWFDGTLGDGGHVAAILEACHGCRVLAVDQDAEALERARERLAEYGDRVDLRKASWDDILQGPALEVFQGALLDLGVRSAQLDRADRGFAFTQGAPLDMRMDPHGGGESAADLLNEGSEERLKTVLHRYGEVPRAGRLARDIVRRRERRAFSTSDDLVAALQGSLGRSPRPREKARVFQALRMEVNDEEGALKRALPGLRDRLRSGGVLAVIAYHSVEDRIVKQAFREWSRTCVCPPGLPVCTCRGEALGTLETRKPVWPSEEEVERNPRARSARLRAWRKG